MITFSRREWLRTSSAGFGYLAFAALAHEAAAREASKDPLAPKPSHFPAKAKRVLFLMMDGGPSHVDTFDYKPRLIADNGKNSSRGRFGGAKLLGPISKFQQRGQSGLWISDLFPHLARHADDLCILNGMATDLPSHPQANLQMHCGISQFPRPSMGAWILYGLGTENANLPGFITLSPSAQLGSANYGSSFLPAIYQGMKISSGGFGGGRFANASNAIPNITNTRRSRDTQRLQLDYIQTLNRNLLEADGPNPAVEGAIEAYELAFRMQAELPKYLDISSESRSTQALYGIGEQATDRFGRQCLLARRLLEAGVRFVEITSGGWDHHRNLKADLERSCTAVDQPIAGLLTDLKQRGLLQDTLVLWGGEFGRTPTSQGEDGRDHNNKGFSMWMAGGGVKPGFVYGRTDDHGFEAVENRMHIHDWHATILHLLGLDHKKLTYRYNGREMRLTDVKGEVANGVIG